MTTNQPIVWREAAAWRCYECDYIQGTDQLLRAPHPFIPNADIAGCVQCRSAGTLERLCEVQGCLAVARCKPDGLDRSVCGWHYGKIPPPFSKEADRGQD